MTIHPDPHPPAASHDLPEPTIWPMVMAAGITLMAAGFVIGVLVFAGGAFLFALAVGGWTRDLVRQHLGAPTAPPPQPAPGEPPAGGPHG